MNSSFGAEISVTLFNQSADAARRTDGRRSRMHTRGEKKKGKVRLDLAANGGYATVLKLSKTWSLGCGLAPPLPACESAKRILI
eukprot:scaffold1583_cov299-Pinguiococcus_pyrenoidosus.AAC.24